ncbi:hypothetical protein PLICRDRAFT_407038 [Plicaturopsis crispa FD-325 SS-3]|nr:hypothetical protein PLICRDRAFT_407038 [Plicaturopsis crispa FD-325 SS-3]
MGTVKNGKGVGWALSKTRTTRGVVENAHGARASSRTERACALSGTRRAGASLRTRTTRGVVENAHSAGRCREQGRGVVENAHGARASLRTRRAGIVENAQGGQCRERAGPGRR